jgi:hypothetical protein
MNHQKEYVVDKKDWPNGPWMNEPDKIQFVTESGYPGLIVRSENSGSLCGYVGININHPNYLHSYHDVDVKVHGGLTYSNKCNYHICHEAKEGEDDNVWWLGFDTAHYDDFIPSLTMHLTCWNHGTYRTIDYVKDQVEYLARQLKEIEVFHAV